jgi:hypothetical protein
MLDRHSRCQVPDHRVILDVEPLLEHLQRPTLRPPRFIGVPIIEVFYLPSYSPELNPDDLLNADLNDAISTYALRYAPIFATYVRGRVSVAGCAAHLPPSRRRGPMVSPLELPAYGSLLAGRVWACKPVPFRRRAACCAKPLLHPSRGRRGNT